MSSVKYCNIVGVIRMLGLVFTSAYGGCGIVMLDFKDTDKPAIPSVLVRLKASSSHS